MRIIKQKSKILSIWLLRGIIVGLFAVAVYVAFGSIDEPGYEWFFLLPVSGGMFFALSTVAWRYHHRLSVLTILFYVIVRYGIIPGAQVWLGEYSDNYRMPSVESIRWAIFLMIYELASIWFFLEVCTRKVLAPSGVVEFRGANYFLLTRRWVILFIVTIAGCVVLFAFPDIKNSYNFIIGGVGKARLAATEGLLLGSEGSGPIMMFFQVARFVIPILLINFCAIYYSKRTSVVWVLLALAVMLPNLLFIFKSSRQGILYFAVPAFLLLPRLFFLHAKFIRYILVFGAILLVTVVTFEKNFSSGNGDVELIDRERLSHTINAYGSTCRNVARAIEAKQGISLMNPQMFFFDATQNIPFIGRILGAENKDQNMVFQYAQWLGRTDQIIPMIGQGNAHWSFLFAPIYSIFFVLLALYLDRCMVNAKDFPRAFVFCLGTIKMIEYPFLLNITIATAFITTFWIPLYFIMLLNHHLGFARGGYCGYCRDVTTFPKR